MRLLASVLASTVLLLSFRDAAPQGTIDKVDPTTIAGTASDPDAPENAVTVHIYVDNVLFDSVVADQPGHRFEYRHAPFGIGAHTISAHALGIDAAGELNGNNPALEGSARPHDFGCQGLEPGSPARDWCDHNPAYWIHRQADTAPLFNRYIWIGVDNSYGGTIFQIYGEDRSTNLLQEHGGAALQLSLWGYEGAAAGSKSMYFRKSPPANPACDATAYPTQAACDAGGAVCGTAGVRPGRGRQITTCDNICNGWDVAAPWNPLQAQGAQCTWDERNGGDSPPSLNDVSVKEAFVEGGKPGWHTVYKTFSNFTKGVTDKTAGIGPFPGLTVDQRVVLGDVYAKITYAITYDKSAPYTLGVHTQEIPALYVNKGIASFGYRSGQPERNVCLNRTPTCCAQSDRACRANAPAFPLAWRTRHLPRDGGWWGVCDETRTRCLTVATFDNDVIRSDTVERTREGYGTLTAAGDFAFTPGVVKTFTIYVFPYKPDAVVEGRSIADRIAALRNQR